GSWLTNRTGTFTFRSQGIRSSASAWFVTVVPTQQFGPNQLFQCVSRSGFLVRNWKVCCGFSSATLSTDLIHSNGTQSPNRSPIEHTKIFEGFLTLAGSSKFPNINCDPMANRGTKGSSCQRLKLRGNLFATFCA